MNDSVKKKTTSTGLAAKFASASLTTKIIAGVLAMGIIIGAGTGIYMTMGSLHRVSQKIQNEQQADIDSTKADKKQQDSDSQVEAGKPVETGKPAEDYYRDYYLENYAGKSAKAVFVDLTHDGRDEMIVVSGEGMSGDMDVFTVKDDKVEFIYGAFAGTITNEMYSHRLYEENGKFYLVSQAFFQRQGFPWYFYKVFSLTEDGQEVLLAGKDLEFSIDDDGSYVGTTEQEVDQLSLEARDYRNKSVTLLDSLSGDLHYVSYDDLPADMTGESLILLDGLILRDDLDLFAFMGTTDTEKGWERLYHGLEINSNYGGWDSLHVTSSEYSVWGIHVGQSKADALEVLKDKTNPVTNDGNTFYVLKNKPLDIDFDFIIVPLYEDDIISEIYYQVTVLNDSGDIL